MRVVALDARQANLLPSRRIPIAIDPAVRAVLPIPVHGAMTLGAQLLRLIPGNLLSEIVNERLPIRRVVAIEAPCIDAVLQMNLGVLGEFAARRARRWMRAVAFTALIREST